MVEQSPAARFITATFQNWRQAGLAFLILRNHEEIFRDATNDIDVLIAPEQFDEAGRLLVETGRALGFQLHLRAEYATHAMYFHEPLTQAQLHFDLFRAFRWHGLTYLETKPILNKRQERDFFAVPHPAHEGVCNLLTGLLYNGKVKQKYRHGIVSAFQANVEEARNLLSATYGDRQADSLVNAAAAGDWLTLEKKSRQLRWALCRKAFLSAPFKAASAVLSDLRRLWRRFRRPPGLALVLCGPDGCGKSTIAPQVQQLLARTFSPASGAHFHWKPGILRRARGNNSRVTSPHSRPPRGPIRSVLFFGLHWLEFLLGWHLRVRPILFRGGLVLIDRWYYDFLVDQRRYRLNVPESLVRLGGRFLGKPDLVILLDAPVEVLRSRKQEVTPEETARQREAYQRVVSTLPAGIIVDASKDPGTVSRNVCGAVLKKTLARTEHS